MEPPAKVRRVGERQTQRDAAAIRAEAKSSEAIHLAASQDFFNRGLFYAAFVSKSLAAKPEEIGPFLKQALKRKDLDEKPTIPVMRALGTIYDRGLSGNYNTNMIHFLISELICRFTVLRPPTFLPFFPSSNMPCHF